MPLQSTGFLLPSYPAVPPQRGGFALNLAPREQDMGLMLAVLQMMQEKEEFGKELGIAERQLSLQEKGAELERDLANLNIEQAKRQAVGEHLRTYSDLAKSGLSSEITSTLKSIDTQSRQEIQAGQKAFDSVFGPMQRAIRRARRGMTSSISNELYSQLQNASDLARGSFNDLTKETQKAGFVTRMQQTLEDLASPPLDTELQQKLVEFDDASAPIRQAYPANSEELNALIDRQKQVWESEALRAVTDAESAARTKAYGLFDQLGPGRTFERDARGVFDEAFSGVKFPNVEDVIRPVLAAEFRSPIVKEPQNLAQRAGETATGVGRWVERLLSGSAYDRGPPGPFNHDIPMLPPNTNLGWGVDQPNILPIDAPVMNHNQGGEEWWMNLPLNGRP